MKYSLLLAAAFVFGFSTLALSHGGAYRGPAGEVPPDSREPSDPPPPPEGGGPTTPGGETGGPTTGGGDIGGPTTGGGDNGGPTTGGDSGGPTVGGGGTGGPTTGGTGRPTASNKGPGYDDWTFWWNFNKDQILHLKDNLRKARPKTGTAVHIFGRNKNDADVISATDAAVNNKIVPALRNLMEDDDLNFDIQSAAALALAKVHDTTQIEKLKDMVRNENNKYHRVVEESAALALGLMQVPSDDIISFLIETVNDDSKNASFVRPFAAISLGLLNKNDDMVVSDALLELISKKQTKVDLKPCALLALGLLEDDRVVDDLVFIIKNNRVNVKGADKLTDVEVSFAVQAIGKIGYADKDLITYFGKKLLAKNTDDHIRRSIAIAFGQIQIEDDTIVSLLTKAIRDREDTSTVNFALISLGKIAARGTDREQIVKTLNYWLDKAKPTNLAQPFAGLGLGLVGRADSDEENINRPLRNKFAESANPRVKSAYAVSLGLARDMLASDELADVLEDKGQNKKLRGYAALGLGLSGNETHKAVIARVLIDEFDRDVRVQTAIAAGLVGDYYIADALIETLSSGEESQYILGSLALALGQIGDERAIDPLIDIANDSNKKYPDITRALAVVSLGQIGDRARVPVLSKVAEDINFRAIGRFPALTELLTIL